MIMRETLHAQPCASGRCWTLVHNHIGPLMVVHDLIRSDPDFIRNKILIIWHILNLIPKRFCRLSELKNYSLLKR